MYSIVLLTEDVLTEHDVTRVVQLHDPEPVHVHVLVPVDTKHNRLVEALDDIALGQLRDATHDTGSAPVEQARVAAGTAMEASVSALQLAGLEADGALVDDDPVAATIAAARERAADEVLVVTEPHLVETTLRRDWGSRIRSSLDRPVLHFVADTDRVV